MTALTEHHYRLAFLALIIDARLAGVSLTDLEDFEMIYLARNLLRRDYTPVTPLATIRDHLQEKLT